MIDLLLLTRARPTVSAIKVFCHDSMGRRTLFPHRKDCVCISTTQASRYILMHIELQKIAPTKTAHFSYQKIRFLFQKGIGGVGPPMPSNTKAARPEDLAAFDRALRKAEQLTQVSSSSNSISCLSNRSSFSFWHLLVSPLLRFLHAS